MTTTIDILLNQNLLEQIIFFLPKVLLATVCGGLIGIERGLKKSVAGLRTNILICVGTTLFTALGSYTAMKLREMAILDGGTNLGAYADPLRLWGQIITGIGFLGAGVIFKPMLTKKDSDDMPQGVTTAGYVWVNCALGMLIGTGGGILALILTTGMIFTLLSLEYLEDKILKGAKKMVPKKILHKDE